MSVQSLFVYPLKGARGISLGRARLDARGITHDRRWMLVDERGYFRSQREVPKLALIDVAIEGDVLTVRTRGMSPLSLPLDPGEGPKRDVIVWDDTCEARALGEDAQRWFTEALSVHSELVYMAEETVRPVDPRFAKPEDRTGFSDGFPLLLTSEPSLAALNERLASPVPMNRFRPNVVVSGCLPFEEDQWARARLGTIEVRLPKRCARCPVVTVDQSTGERGKEPLAALAKFRRDENKVYFGQNVIHDATGEIAVGDEVEVLERVGLGAT